MSREFKNFQIMTSLFSIFQAAFHNVPTFIPNRFITKKIMKKLKGKWLDSKASKMILSWFIT